jgi:hypothetical protein
VNRHLQLVHVAEGRERELVVVARPVMIGGCDQPGDDRPVVVGGGASPPVSRRLRWERSCRTA